MIHKKTTLLSILFLCLFLLVSSVQAQSGRNKPEESPSPTPKKIYTPTSDVKISVTATPTPTPKPIPQKIEDDDVITVDSILVPIPVSVTDSNGKPVLDLKLEDFLLEVEGKKVEITDISKSETPVNLALLFDNSSSLTSAREFELKAATRFFKKVLSPNKDRAALYSFSTGSRLEQALTKEYRLLVKAIENFPQPEGATALLDVIIKAATYLEETDGRKIIVIVSDGVDTYSDASLEETVKSAQINNVQIYVVRTTDFENFQRTGVRKANANLRDLAAERRMMELTGQTGGAVYSPVDEKELDAAFTQIAAELSQQYILGYYPEGDLPKGKFNQVNVSVKRPNVKVRNRTGFFTPK